MHAWPQDLLKGPVDSTPPVGGQFMPCENAEFRLHLEMVSRLYWRLNSWLFFMHNGASNFIVVKK